MQVPDMVHGHLAEMSFGLYNVDAVPYSRWRFDDQVTAPFGKDAARPIIRIVLVKLLENSSRGLPLAAAVGFKALAEAFDQVAKALSARDDHAVQRCLSGECAHGFTKEIDDFFVSAFVVHPIGVGSLKEVLAEREAFSGCGIDRFARQGVHDRSCDSRQLAAKLGDFVAASCGGHARKKGQNPLDQPAGLFDSRIGIGFDLHSGHIGFRMRGH